MIENELKSIVTEIHFKQLFDQASDLIHFATPEGIIVYVNQSWKSSLGYHNDEIIGRSLYDFIHPSEIEKFRLFRQELINNKLQATLLETSFLSKTGEVVIVEGSIACRFENDLPLHTSAILRDVTKRKREELRLQRFNDELMERDENFQQLIRYAPDGIIVIDDTSHIILWNPKSQEIFGWEAEEVKGLALDQTIIPVQHRKAHLEGLKRYLSTGELRVLNKTIEITALNKCGEEFFIALTISRASMRGKTIFIAFVRDIRHEKKMQEELHLQKHQLEKSNEELAQYASLASHDLKEPIRKILIFTDKIINSHAAASVPGIKESMLKIYSAAKRMSALITGVSKFSNILVDEKQLTKVDLYQVIEDVKWDLDLMVKHRDATIVLSDLPEVTAMPIHMYQLFQNLISNSIKYSKPDTAPFITITGKDTNEEFAEIIVEDNGIGFDNKYAVKAFQAFQRLHGTHYEGTGIGLSICKKIVEVYGGIITVESEPGKGSRFAFTLRK